jgi:chemotaxis protein CheD
MSTITVGIGEWAVSRDGSDLIKTFALGSCVAVMIYDTSLHLAGLIHVALPDSKIDQGLAAKQPGKFADTGLPLMIEEMKALGARRANIWVKLAGGASMMDPEAYFDIGKRNILAVKRVLWKSTLGPLAEDTGGDTSRTVTMEVGTGLVTLNSAGRTWAL